MAQSRPPPVRTHAAGACSPPPLSPRAQERGPKHHARRKSGKDHAVTEKKPSRPATLNRRQTPQYVTRPSALASGRRDRERERDDEERSRDSGESFPQYCMSCEKQFLPADNTFVYCSDNCRAHDQAPTPTTHSHHAQHPQTTTLFPPEYVRASASYSGPSHSYSHAHEEGPDIIPRFSPTQSRPRSYFNSDPYPATYQTPQSYAPDPSTALASLRELATALPRGGRGHRPDSPPLTRPTSGVWNYMPFTSGSKTALPTPGNSYSAGAATYAVSSQSYGGTVYAQSKEDWYAYGKSHAANPTANHVAPSLGMDRPLPPRGGPGGYGHRPRSIDLVTPFAES